MTWVSQLIEDMDVVPARHFKKFIGSDDLWEVRVQIGNNIFRLLWFLENDKVVILNHALQKKTQKTPKREIQIAEAGKRDYLKMRV